MVTGPGRRLSRAELDGIIESTTVAYRIEHFTRIGWWPGAEENEESFRVSLRLDDPVLTELIESRTGPIQWSEHRALEHA